MTLSLREVNHPIDDWPGFWYPDHLESGRPVGRSADWRACWPIAIGRESEEAFDDERYAREFEDYLLAKPLSKATARKHAINAMYLLEYLCRWSRVRFEALHEFDLRTFLYDWSPRKSSASRTDAKALLSSLKHFLRYLTSTADLRYPWALEILKDRSTFLQRFDDCPVGPFWIPAVQTWRTVGQAHLEALALSPTGFLADDDQFGATMGRDEARLYEELQRLWLHWRDDVIEGGLHRWEDVMDVLRGRQRKWAAAPQGRLDGESPYQVILAERDETETRRAASSN